MRKIGLYVTLAVISVFIFFLQFSYEKKYHPYTYYQVYLDNEVIGVIDSKSELDSYISEQGKVIQDQLTDYKADIERIKNYHSILGKTINKKSTLYSNYYNMIILERNFNIIYKNVDNKGMITGDYIELSKVYNSLPTYIVENTYLTSEKIVNYNTLVANLDNRIRFYNNQLYEYINNISTKLKLTDSENSYLEDYYSNKLYETKYSKYLYMLKYTEDNAIYLTANDIYEPLGINVKKIVTYNKDVIPVEDAYSKIISIKPCTVEGYQLRIKKTETSSLTSNTIMGAQALTDYKEITKIPTNEIIIYVTEKKIFNEAVENVASVFIGSEKYEAYKKNKQKELKTTGVYINDVYLDESITIKKTNISVDNKIYTDSQTLASYLLYGDNNVSRTVIATSKDNITDLAFKYKISLEEFFLSNPSFTSVNNMFYDGQKIIIKQLNPKIRLIVEETQVEDKTVKYNTVEKYDNTMNSGSEYVEQKGSNGVVRVSQNLKIINGATSSVTPISNETIKASTDKVVLIGTKILPTVGSVSSWGWPTCKSYTITSPFGYRQYPFGGGRELHAGLDIAGCGYGSPIYASNNGTIYSIKVESWNYGKSVIIDHHNGYYTNYGHMSGFAKGLKVGQTVARGQVIGYMGHTGAATGTHLHFEIRVGAPNYSNVTNPYPYLMK